MAVLNSTILERAWLSGSNDYQQRIPNPAISSYADHVAALFDPMNHDLFNQFSGLLNGLMGTYVESKLFENPLAVLKKPASQWGNTERRVAVKYLQAHSYKVDDETLLKLERPEFVEWFYSVGEPRRYEFNWSKYELQRAFSADGYGYDELLQATITQAYSSDNYDEMNIMIQMFAEADRRMGGLYRYNVSAAPTDEATAKELLKGIRTVAGRMRFPSMLYNHIPVPVHENGDTLVVWVTPEVMASLDVDALSAVFQLDKAEVQYRIIQIPEFPIPNVYAAITSEDFIYARDVWYGIEPPFYNPANLTLKYYLHHAQMIGVNPAANCVLFTTDANTAIPTITMNITGAAFTPATGNVEIGGSLKTNFALAGTVSPTGTKIAVEPDSAIYTVTGENSGGDPIELNSRTYVDNAGVLHVQKSGIAVGSKINVSAVATYTNPSGATTERTATFTATVTAATSQGAKECAVETDPYITYTDETEEATASE